MLKCKHTPSLPDQCKQADKLLYTLIFCFRIRKSLWSQICWGRPTTSLAKLPFKRTNGAANAKTRLDGGPRLLPNVPSLLAHVLSLFLVCLTPWQLHCPTAQTQRVVIPWKQAHTFSCVAWRIERKQPSTIQMCCPGLLQSAKRVFTSCGQASHSSADMAWELISVSSTFMASHTKCGGCTNLSVPLCTAACRNMSKPGV